MPNRFRRRLLPDQQAMDQWGEAIQALQEESQRTTQEREADPEKMTRLLDAVEKARLKFAIADAAHRARSTLPLPVALPDPPHG